MRAPRTPAVVIAAQLALLTVACSDSHVVPPRGPDGEILGPCEIAPGISRCNGGGACQDCVLDESSLICFIKEVITEDERTRFGEGACLPMYDGQELCNYQCRFGQVCVPPYDRSGSFDDITISGGLCMDARECVRARDALGRVAAASCLYGDMTAALTGELPRVDCADRPHPHLCGNGCPCNDDALCYFASEAHPWGVCANRVDTSSSCRSADGCGLGGCLGLIPAADVGERWTHVPSPICIAAEACATLVDLYPDAFRCL